MNADGVSFISIQSTNRLKREKFVGDFLRQIDVRHVNTKKAMRLIQKRFPTARFKFGEGAPQGNLFKGPIIIASIENIVWVWEVNE